MNFLGRVRWSSWALLVICFILPFAKGCNDQPIYPYQTAFSNFGAFLTWGLPFLYPLLFVFVTLVAWALRQPARREQFFHMLFLASFGALTTLVIRWHVALLLHPLEWPDPELLVFLGLVAVWASMGVRADRLSAEEIPRRLAVQWSVAAWIIVGVLFVLADPLAGGWIAFGSASAVLVSYTAEYFGRRLRPNPEAA